MPSRFYLPSTSTAAVSPTINTGDWTLHQNTVRREMDIAKLGSTLTQFDYIPDAADHLVDGEACAIQFVSKGLGAQTISAQTVTLVIQSQEPNAGCNQAMSWKLYVVNAAGSSVVGTLVAYRRDNNEMLHVAGGGRVSRTDSTTCSSLAVSNGDRLVLEVGSGGLPTAASAVQGHNPTFWFGDSSATDLPNSDSDTTTTKNPWLEFATDTLTFETTLLEPPAAVGTGTVPTALLTAAVTLAAQVAAAVATVPTASLTIAGALTPGPAIGTAVAPTATLTASTTLTPASAIGTATVPTAVLSVVLVAGTAAATAVVPTASIGQSITLTPPTAMAGAEVPTPFLAITTYPEPPAESALDLRRRILGAWAPWLPDNMIPWRQQCHRLYRVSSALVWGSEIAGLTIDGSRQVEVADGVLYLDTLSLSIADPTGLHLQQAGLEPGALVGLETVVTTPAGSYTLRPMIYRITQGLTQSLDRWGRATWRTQGEDYLRAVLDQPLGGYPLTGTTPIGIGSPLATAAALTGTYGGTWLELTTGLYGLVLGSGVAAIEGTRTGGTHPFLGPDDTVEGFQDWLATRAWPTWREVLVSLQATFGWRASYGTGYLPYVLDADTRVDSGYIVSADADRPGAFPVPWERVERQPARAQYTAVEIWYGWLDDSTPPQQILVRAARATSTSQHNPHTPPLGRTEYLVSDIAAAAAVGGSIYDSAASVAARRLQQYLGRADTLTVTVSSACPPPEPDTEVVVWVPDEGIQVWAALQSASIPLNTAAASWALHTRQDAYTRTPVVVPSIARGVITVPQAVLS